MLAPGLGCGSIEILQVTARADKVRAMKSKLDSTGFVDRSRYRGISTSGSCGSGLGPAEVDKCSGEETVRPTTVVEWVELKVVTRNPLREPAQIGRLRRALPRSILRTMSIFTK